MNLMIQTWVWLIDMSCNAVYCGALKCQNELDQKSVEGNNTK